MHIAVILISQLLAAAPLDGSPGLPVTGSPGRGAPVGMVDLGGVNWTNLREAADTGQTRRRTKAIEYSGFYRTRLGIHKWLSFIMIPLFVGSYVTGDQILKKSTDAPQWARDYHRPLATATAVLFSVNTITGLWNLWDSRKDPSGRAKRYLHSLLFIAADAGFTWSGVKLANDAESSQAMRLKHRNVALASMGASVTSWAMMLLFK